MRAYKFLSAGHAIDDIRNRQVKVSEFPDMNDPFELIGAKWDREDVDAIFSRYFFSKGCLCLSRSWTHPLLWSHYADKHRGICLGFEVPDDDDVVLTPVYVSIPELHSSELIFEALKMTNKSEIEDQIVRKLILKFEDWRYEDVQRGHRSQRICGMTSAGETTAS